jgi:hypothetical protein
MSRVLRTVVRVAWIPVACAVLAAVIAYVLVGSSSPSYTSSLLLVIPSTQAAEPGTPEVGPSSSTTTTAPDPIGRPTETLRLAGIYAELIPNDTATLTKIAQETGQDFDEVQGSLSAVVLPDSSLIRITITAPTASQSKGGLDALQAALIGPSPSTPAIAPGSLIFVSADGPNEQGQATDLVLPAALVLGLCLGGFLAVVWTRNTAHIDSLLDLEELVDVPVVELAAPGVDRTSIDGPIMAVARAWWQKNPTDEVVISLVAVSSRAAVAARHISGEWPEEGLVDARVAGPKPLRVRVIDGGQAGTPEGVAAMAAGNVAAVVLTLGDRTEHLRRAEAAVRRLGLPVIAALVVRRRELHGLTANEAASSAADGSEQDEAAEDATEQGVEETDDATAAS